jgi:hypothetical protein
LFRNAGYSHLIGGYDCSLNAEMYPRYLADTYLLRTTGSRNSLKAQCVYQQLYPLLYARQSDF